MKIEIKKEYAVSLAGFVILLSGYFVLEIILSALVDSGWYGFVYLSLFLISLYILVRFFVDYKIRVTTAKEAVREVVEEQLKSNPELFDRTSPEALRSQIEEHLIKKLNEEKYVIWKKA